MSTTATYQRGRSPSDLPTAGRPRLGFVGVGWVGRHRMSAIANSGLAQVAAIVEPSTEMQNAARSLAPGAVVHDSIEDLTDHDLDGIVIATPNAMHADQAVRALERGLAVFCQKPLAPTAAESQRVIDAARAADRLLCVDLSYRHIAGVREIRESIRRGEFGKIFAAHLVFHNAYGPDKPWYYDRQLSGGGCVIDLGIHLIDLALWVLSDETVEWVSSLLVSEGEIVPAGHDDRVEDYAVAQFEMSGGTVLDLACSWRLNAGRDAVIEASFYGTRGGISLRNVDGSFYDFKVERYRGTTREEIASTSNWEWGGEAALDWTRRLASGEGYDPECERLIDVAKVIDQICGE